MSPTSRALSRRSPGLAAHRPAGLPMGAPGAREVDPELLDAAVSQLNAIYVQRGLQTARELVAVLVETFWNGSLERALTGTDRHATFQALRGRGDLQVGYATLVRMLRVVALLHRLQLGEQDEEEGLSFSHLAELLRLKDRDREQELAEQAVAEKWSVRDLRAAVQAANGEVVVPKGPLRTLHTGLKRSTRVVQQAIDDARALLDDPEERAAADDVLSELDALVARCAELREILEAAAEGGTG